MSFFFLFYLFISICRENEILAYMVIGKFYKWEG